MLRTKKVCNIEQCDFPVYGKSLCFYHYRQEIGKKYSLKRSSLNKVSEKGKIKKEEKAANTKELHNWFKQLWQKVSHNCQSCGKYLGNEPLNTYFDHLLEKSKYPEHTFNEENIYICCLDCHNQKTNGFPTDNHKKAIEEVKNKFNI